MKRAVLYLRVSTTSQVTTDYDPEGISIPAQRLACTRKAEQMGVQIVGEYVEPGRSGTSIEKRPVFQEMLARLKSDQDVDYVIVYNLSRLNRNRVDDARVLMLMRSFKTTLVSAQENIDETPAGQLMHGILAAFNEYRSNADGADIRYKMGQKAKNGGTLGRAPLGYLNLRDHYEGREIRTVGIDPERGPLIVEAFELFAGGNYSLVRLADEMTKRGLTPRARSGRAAAEISAKQLGRILRDRYYLGIVTYNEVEYPGRHEALVSHDVFERAQAVMREIGAEGERDRKHRHYLKSTVWCGRCHARGVEQRLVLERATNRYGVEYVYFLCLGRQHKTCDLPHLRAEYVEQCVIEHYATMKLPTDVHHAIEGRLADELANEQQVTRQLRKRASKRIAEIDRQEDNLLDLASAGELVPAKVRTRLALLAEEREALRGQLTSTEPVLAAGAALLQASLDLMERPQELYRQTTDAGRRHLNQVFFSKLYLDDTGVEDELLRAPFDEFAPQRLHRVYQRKHGAPRDAVSIVRTRTSRLEATAHGRGSSKGVLVELRGLEPLTPTLPGRPDGVRRRPPEYEKAW